MGSDERGHVPACPGPSDHCGYCGRMCLVGEECPARVERAHCEAVASQICEDRWLMGSGLTAGVTDREYFVGVLARERSAAKAEAHRAATEVAARHLCALCRKGYPLFVVPPSQPGRDTEWAHTPNLMNMCHASHLRAALGKEQG